jgi:hypothetical protein
MPLTPVLLSSATTLFSLQGRTIASTRKKLQLGKALKSQVIASRLSYGEVSVAAAAEIKAGKRKLGVFDSER